MATMWLLRVLFSVTLLFISISANAGAAAKTILLTTSEWVPYVINNDKQHGYAYDVVKAAFETMGYTVTIKILPWPQALAEAEKGQVDGVFPEYYTLSRSKFFEFSNPFLAGPLVLYKRVNSNISLEGLNVDDLDRLFNALKSYRFGVVTGYANVPAFDKNASLIKVAVNTDKENLQQLYDGKVDLILIDKLNAQYLIRYELPANVSEALVPLLPAVRQNNIYVAFSKARYGHAAVVTDFNKGLLRLQNNRTTTQLMSHYLYEFIDKDIAPKKINTLN